MGGNPTSLFPWEACVFHCPRTKDIDLRQLGLLHVTGPSALVGPVVMDAPRERKLCLSEECLVVGLFHRKAKGSPAFWGKHHVETNPGYEFVSICWTLETWVFRPPSNGGSGPV